MSEATPVAGCSKSSSVDVSNSQTTRCTIDLPRKRTVRRNRKAASTISRIEFITNEARDVIAATHGDVKRLEDVDGEKIDDVKRLRLSASDRFETLSEIGDTARCVGSTSDRECSPQADRYVPELNGKIRFGYSFIGPGKDLYATHMETGVHKQCQIIDKVQYQQIIKVRQRLNEAGKYWKYEDVAEMSDFVLPAETEIYEWGQGKYLYLSSWQYGTLDVSVISEKGKDSTENTVRHLFGQILRGVAFCHALGIIVRDLKPRKFAFIDHERTTLRLHDVQGLYVCEGVKDDIMTDHHGVPAYVAPEILRRAPVEYSGKPADIWALGVLLYYLLFSRHPFSDTTLSRVFMRICRVSFCIPPGFFTSHAARVLIYGIFKKEPLERPTAEQLLNFRWFSETLNPRSPLYPALRPCVNLITGASGNRQGVPFSSTLNGTGRSLLSHSYRCHRNHRVNEEVQVVPNGLQSPNVSADSSNIVTISATAAARYIDRIYSLSRRSLPNLGFSDSVL